MGLVRFDPATDVVRLTVGISGPGGLHRNVTMILDPGSAFVILHPEPARALGLDVGAAESRRIVSAHRPEDAPQILIPRMKAMGETAENVTAVVVDLPRELGAYGLLGNSFLRQFHLEIRYPEGIAILTRPALP